MKLTAKSEYALLALVFLARQKPGDLFSVKTIAKEQGIPEKYLEQIMLVLKRSRHVRSVKGQRGGFTLAKHPHEISLAEVIRLLDGALAPTESVSRYFYEPTPIARERALTRVFKTIRDHTARVLERTTLEDVAR
jgi:Rrf2 family transcriptional regulator, cysteine metabolism repressor